MSTCFYHSAEYHQSATAKGTLSPPLPFLLASIFLPTTATARVGPSCLSRLPALPCWTAGLQFVTVQPEREGLPESLGHSHPESGRKTSWASGVCRVLGGHPVTSASSSWLCTGSTHLNRVSVSDQEGVITQVTLKKPWQAVASGSVNSHRAEVAVHTWNFSSRGRRIEPRLCNLVI